MCALNAVKTNTNVCFWEKASHFFGKRRHEWNLWIVTLLQTCLFYSYVIQRMKCQIITYYFISHRTWQRPNCFPYISWVTSCWVESRFSHGYTRRFLSTAGLWYQKGGTTATQTNPKQCTKRKYRTGSLLRKENVSWNRQLSFPYTSRTVPGGKGHGCSRPRLVEGFATKWEPQVMTWPVSPVNPSLWPLPFSSYFSLGSLSLKYFIPPLLFHLAVFIPW